MSAIADEIKNQVNQLKNTIAPSIEQYNKTINKKIIKTRLYKISNIIKKIKNNG